MDLMYFRKKYLYVSDLYLCKHIICHNCEIFLLLISFQKCINLIPSSKFVFSTQLNNCKISLHYMNCILFVHIMPILLGSFLEKKPKNDHRNDQNICIWFISIYCFYNNFWRESQRKRWNTWNEHLRTVFSADVK